MRLPRYKLLGFTNLLPQMFKHLPNLVPVVFIFAVAFSFSILGNVYHTQHSVKRDGQQIINILERYIDSEANELYLLNRQLSGNCSVEDKLALRAHTFNSKYIKEVGMYQGEYVRCTSNEGPTKIELPSDVIERLHQSDKGVTIAIDQSSSHLSTFFIYAATGDDIGLNALLPPERFTRLIAQFLDNRHYQFKLSIQDYQIGNLEPKQIPYLSPVTMRSAQYPIAIELLPTYGTFQYHYFKHVWQTILAASICALIYLIIGYQLLAKGSMEFSLMHAISNQEIELYLQPIVDQTTNTIVGSEALVRWNHPTQGHIAPDIFIPLAEKLGVIDSLTEKMLAMVAQFLETYPHYQETKYVSVNVSRISLIDDNFYLSLQQFAEKHPGFVDRILLEVTENIDFNQDQLDLALNNLRRIKNLGFQLAIDDFGTGYSGLNFIRMHPFQVMKIDQVFIKSLHSESSITPVLVSMIQLARELNMHVIAEGVETEQQLELLNKLGVHYIQGYYYSQPVKPDELIALTKEPSGTALEDLPAT